MGHRDVCIADGTVLYRRRLSVFEVNKQIPKDFIKNITVQNCGSANNTQYYAVEVEHNDVSQISALERYLRSKSTSDKRFDITMILARDISSKAEALWLADRLKEQLGIYADRD